MILTFVGLCRFVFCLLFGVGFLARLSRVLLVRFYLLETVPGWMMILPSRVLASKVFKIQYGPSLSFRRSHHTGNCEGVGSSVPVKSLRYFPWSYLITGKQASVPPAVNSESITARDACRLLMIFVCMVSILSLWRHTVQRLSSPPARHKGRA